MTHPLAALIGLDIEDVARAVYDAMRFERRDKTPEWVKGGNSNAQVEARATAARILAAPHVNETPKSEHDAGNVLTVPDLVAVLEMSARIWSDNSAADKSPTFSRGDCREWAERYASAAAMITAQAAQIAGLTKKRDACPIGMSEEARDLGLCSAATCRACLGRHMVAWREKTLAAEAKLKSWHVAIAPLMPPDFKDWHENSPSDWPLVTAAVISSARQKEAIAEAQADTLRAEVERLRGAGKDAADAWEECLGHVVSALGKKPDWYWHEVNAIKDFRAALEGKA